MGKRVKIRGLLKHADLNGKEGEVVAPGSAVKPGRCAVKLDGGEKKAIKMKYLHEIVPGDAGLQWAAPAGSGDGGGARAAADGGAPRTQNCE